MSDPSALAPKAAPPGSPAWYALLFTPAALRDAAAALLELRAEILDSARRPQEPAVARARLEWWRAELAGFGRGRGQHPLTRRLAGLATQAAVQQEYLVELVDAAESELAEAPCRNYAELALYCYRSSGVLHEMLAAVPGLADPANERAVRKHAQRLGSGVRLVDVIAGLRGDLAAGRRLLPRDWIEETGARNRSRNRTSPMRRWPRASTASPARRASRWTKPRPCSPPSSGQGSAPAWCSPRCTGAGSPSCTPRNSMPPPPPATSKCSGPRGAQRAARAGARTDAEDNPCMWKK
jgi:phytoene/squalene synthetase